MAWPIAMLRVTMSFIVGTLVLWLCSLTVKTKRANVRTAAIYNASVTAFGGILLVVALLIQEADPAIAKGVFLTSTLSVVIISFLLLMRLYDISFLATLWLLIAVAPVRRGIEKLIDILM